MFKIKLADQSSNGALIALERDPVLIGSNGGMRGLFDLAFPYSYPGGDPADEAVIVDVAGGANLSFQKHANQTIPYVGGGFDFGAINTALGEASKQNYIQLPSSSWGDIQASQNFLVCLYQRMPAEADWIDDSVSTMFANFASSASPSGYVVTAEPLTGGMLRFKRWAWRRQTALNVVETRALDAVGHYGQVCQLAYWRNAAGQGTRIKSVAGGLTEATYSRNADNALDFSTLTPKIGVSVVNSSYATSLTAMKYRIYRGFIENLQVSGRDPVEVLDADFERVIARGVFS